MSNMSAGTNFWVNQEYTIGRNMLDGKLRVRTEKKMVDARSTVI